MQIKFKKKQQKTKKNTWLLYLESYKDFKVIKKSKSFFIFSFFLCRNEYDSNFPRRTLISFPRTGSAWKPEPHKVEY